MAWKKIGLRMGGMLVGGLAPTFLEWSFGETRREVLIPDSLLGICIATMIGSLCWLILPRVAGRILRLPFALKWMGLIVLITAIAAVGVKLAIALVVVFHVIPGIDANHVFWNAVRISIVITFVFSLSVMFHEIAVDRLRKAQKDLEEKDLAQERLRQAAVEARLSSLESKIHPHFLFNTLNSITALIRENPMEAERMVERLSALLRFSLDSSGARLVPLVQELAIVRSYLEIEKVRFGSRLRYAIECDPLVDEVQVPPLSVQTLVENSVKYAVSPRREGAEIIVRARVRDGKPVIDVIDDGPGFSTADLKAGHGLDLLQSRLAAQFGSEAALEFGREPNLTRVTVAI
jgi:LytS/YehU family sensor histidine kinase